MDNNSDNDPLEGLEERLQSHSRAFESLLALTPARDYYGSHVVDGSDPSEQWNRKKQTKEQKRAAKKAKLDPANQKSALDVMKEREAEALKRKRSEEDGVEVLEEVEGTQKRQRSEEDADTAEARRREKAEKKKEARIRKKEKRDAKKAKVEAKKARKQERAQEMEKQESESGGVPLPHQDDEDAEDAADNEDDMEKMDLSGLAELADEPLPNVAQSDEEASSAPTSPVINSPAFDVGTNTSAASSSSSVIPPSVADSDQFKLSRSATTKPASVITQPEANSNPPAKAKDAPSGIASPKLQLPNIDHAVLQERLRQRIEALRAERKADGADGNPAKSRQELLEQRRKKEEQRKAAKKENIRKIKEEERRKQEERLRGSGSPLGSDMFSPRSPQPRENNFAFSRLAFDDGATADAELTGIHEAKKRKGPQDTKTALQAAQAKKARIAGFDAEKRADIADKEMWLNASKHAHGERVRDDTNLLKKALKRKEKQKNKSELQWKEREEAVVKGKEMKQKKRETNLLKRREEKGGKGKKKVGAKGGAKKKSRPGFEGRLKA